MNPTPVEETPDARRGTPLPTPVEGPPTQVQSWTGDFRQNPPSGYRCRVKTGDSDAVLAIEEFASSRKTELAGSAAFPLLPDVWYSLSFSAVGGELVCQLSAGGAPLASVSAGSGSSAPPTYASGYAGTWNYVDDHGAHYWKQLVIADVDPSNGGYRRSLRAPLEPLRAL